MAGHPPPRHWREYRHRLLTAGLLLTILASPLVVRGYLSGLFTESVGATVLLLFVAVTYRRRAMVVGGSLLALVVVGSLAFYATSNFAARDVHEFIGRVSLLLGIVFLMYILGIILRDVLANKRVTLDTVFGALCGYLLLGLLWASIYLLLYRINPESFRGLRPSAALNSPEAIYDDQATFHYFSFATLTTLGFGDITPTGHVTRTLAWMEAAVGQMYLAVLVALETAQQVERYEERRRTRDSLPPPHS